MSWDGGTHALRFSDFLRCNPAVHLFYLAGKGKRRRSSDEDATGEPKAKRSKHSTDNKEVTGLGVLTLRQGRKST